MNLESGKHKPNLRAVPIALVEPVPHWCLFRSDLSSYHMCEAKTKIPIATTHNYSIPQPKLERFRARH